MTDVCGMSLMMSGELSIVGYDVAMIEARTQWPLFRARENPAKHFV